LKFFFHPNAGISSVGRSCVFLDRNTDKLRIQREKMEDQDEWEREPFPRIREGEDIFIGAWMNCLFLRFRFYTVSSWGSIYSQATGRLMPYSEIELIKAAGAPSLQQSVYQLLLVGTGEKHFDLWAFFSPWAIYGLTHSMAPDKEKEAVLGRRPSLTYSP